MPEQEIQIKRIQEKLQQLLQRQEELRKENYRIKKELERSKLLSSEQVQTIELLKQQVEILKISSGNWDEKDKKEFEKRITSYIKEIDKCIAILSE